MLRKLIQSDQQPEAYHRLADLWRLRGRPELAMEAYRKALKSNAAYLPACIELTSLLIKREEFTEALAVCKSACALDPNNRLLKSRIQEILDLISAPKKEIHPDRTVEVEYINLQNQKAKSAATVLLYSDCSGMDGAEQCSHLLMKDWLEAGYQVVCAQPFADHVWVTERARIGIRHVWLDKDELYAGSECSGGANAQSEIENIMRDIQPDLVFFSDGAPFSSLIAKRAVRQLGIPYLALIHCVNERWEEQHETLLEEMGSAFEGAQEVISVSQENLEQMHSRFRLPENKGRVLYNGRPQVYFEPRNEAARARIREELEIAPDAVVCVTVARMEIMKGYQFLLEAIGRNFDSPAWEKLRFVWVGTGTLENRFRSRAAEIGVDSIIYFLGTRNDIPDILDASDMFVLPSQYEGMPLSIIEAMAKGLPVIATRVSGIPEALGGTGKLISNPNLNPDASTQELAQSIEDWGGAIGRGESLGEAGRVRALEFFNEHKMRRAYRTLLKNSLMRGKTGAESQDKSIFTTETSEKRKPE